MVKFQIQPDSEISIATQLYDQLSFAITSGQYPPGKQLPSTRQLAAWTGIHRNTVNKVYQQLKEAGLVDAQSGAGVFVKLEGKNGSGELSFLAQTAIDRLVQSGYSLELIKQTLNEELNWRLRCACHLWVVCHAHDPGVAKIMASQIKQEINVPIEVVTIEGLPQLLAVTNVGTIVTNRYLYNATKTAAEGFNIPIVSLDIYHYQQELERVKTIPTQSYIGIISASNGILRIAENIIRSARGEDLVIVTATPQQQEQIFHIARFAQMVFVADSPECLQEAVVNAQSLRIRPLEIIYCESYIARDSMERLKLELGITQFTKD